MTNTTDKRTRRGPGFDRTISRQVRLSQAEEDELTAAATAARQNRSEYVRQAIRERIARER